MRGPAGTPLPYSGYFLLRMAGMGVGFVLTQIMNTRWYHLARLLFVDVTFSLFCISIRPVGRSHSRRVSNP